MFSTGVLTIVIMLAVTYAFLHEGVTTAFCMFCNVMLAGFITFNFWEPLADQLEDAFAGGSFHGYEDFLSLMALFALSLGVLRLVTNKLLPTQASLDPRVQAAGSAIVGLLTGYFVAGFLVCALQTLPWHERFLNFDARIDVSQKFRRLVPADRVWLATMQRASEVSLAPGDGVLFDPEGSFEQRYARFRRYGDSRDAIPSARDDYP